VNKGWQYLLMSTIAALVSVRSVQAQILSGPERHEWNTWENSVFTANVGLLAIADGVVYSQDDANIQQVGAQDDEVAWRALRFFLIGQLKFERPWIYAIGVNFNSFEAEKADRWSVLDFRVDIPVGKTARLRVGREKVGVSQEWIMPGNDMVMMERSTVDLAFVPQRNNGVQITDNFAGQRGLWSVGAFNDWITTGNSFSENGNQYTARIGYLPVDADEGASLVQVAGALYYREATEGQIQFRARPEVNEADYFFDTGKFNADHSLMTQVELIGINGPLMVVANASITQVSAPQANNPTFHGWYTSVGYALTGEHHSFNRRDGYYGALLPKSPLGEGGSGAWEVSARYSVTDLIDGTIDGGRISRWTGALSWVPSRPWRFELNYGYIKLDHGVVGHANSFSARIQWFAF
jgi:phosphate-selective porin OprO and OprP